MKLAMIGLGKMGLNMADRLTRGGHTIIGHDINNDVLLRARIHGISTFDTLEAVVAELAIPRIVWVMVRSHATGSTLYAISNYLTPGDILIDGGNTNYKESIRHAKFLGKKGLRFLDVGTSGGIWGLENGYSLMVGGHVETVAYVKPVFEALAPAPNEGWGHMGPSGSGHFVKMIHNGIEYGMMQALAEGFEILHQKQEFNLDLSQIVDVWRDGSVVRSWLLDLTARAFEHEGQDLKGIVGKVRNNGEARWMVAEAIEMEIPAPVISLALMMRFSSAVWWTCCHTPSVKIYFLDGNRPFWT